MDEGVWVGSSTPYVRLRGDGEPEPWAEEAAVSGGKGTQRITFAGEVSAPPVVARLLGEDGAVVVRRRVMYLDGVPTELTDTYYPSRIASGTALARKEKIRGGAVALLRQLGHAGRRVEEEVSARMPTAQERDALGLTETQPVLTLTRRTLDADEGPLQVDLMVFPAHRQRLRYEMALA
ncbi:UTRA domain-containing protein [Streptomyces sp. ICBB 8177]|uniref:GntR family transcriptional regulator n=1 Tax=Streptomyces sp. ICBB 8177 TaxID=563922 RepID=UPI000D67EEFD|nr:UTRA domain-containing protein [Streptomyces sp. ICBB 8177]PWI45931.1 UTRA domain-containing protein [Streptomyces sp. ICBB 8177]